MATRQYIGARYVPKFAEPLAWNRENSYEALTIVSYLNNSYTSKKPVPANIDITNSEYWVVTGNYNAQVEEYRKDTKALTENFIVLSSNGGNPNGLTDNTDVINSLINRLGNERTSIWITKGNYLISGDVTIPSNIDLRFDGGTLLVGDSGDLKINGQIIAPLYTIFKVKGKLTINKNNNTIGYPEWFDDNVNLAIQYFKCVELQAKDYFIKENLIINGDNITLRGTSFSTFYGTEGGTRLVLLNGCEIIVGNTESLDINVFPRNITLENFEIAQTTQSADGALEVFGVVYGRFKNLTITVSGNNNFGIKCLKNVSTIYESCRVQTTNNSASVFNGFYLPSTSSPILAGNNGSIYFNNCTVASTGVDSGTSIGWSLNGACSDTFLNGCETAKTSYGITINNASTIYGANDILINNCVLDACTDHCISINNITVDGAICISNTYMAKDESNNATHSCLYIENCKASVTLSNVQMLSLNTNNIGLQINGNTPLIGNGIIANGMNTPFVNSGSTSAVYCQYLHNGTLTTVSP